MCVNSHLEFSNFFGSNIHTVRATLFSNESKVLRIKYIYFLSRYIIWWNSIFYMSVHGKKITLVACACVHHRKSSILFVRNSLEFWLWVKLSWQMQLIPIQFNSIRVKLFFVVGSFSAFNRQCSISILYKYRYAMLKNHQTDTHYIHNSDAWNKIVQLYALSVSITITSRSIQMCLLFLQ